VDAKTRTPGHLNSRGEFTRPLPVCSIAHRNHKPSTVIIANHCAFARSAGMRDGSEIALTNPSRACRRTGAEACELTEKI
jgi:hypothetical protein